MSFTSALKTAEADAAKAWKFIQGEAPVLDVVADSVAVASGNASAVATIDKIAAVVTNAGAIATTVNAQATGADKLNVAAPAVDALIKSSGFLGKSAVANVSKWDAAIKAITGAVADLLDSIEAKPATTATTAPAPAPPVVEQPSA
jgi:hypothetical protein